jgi:hypothetical protein
VWNRSLTAADVSLLPGAAAETNLAAALLGKWLQDKPVGELSSNGTFVLRATVAGGWPGSTNTFSLAEHAGGRFAIHAASGLVTVANRALLDYEAATNHTIIVRATEGRSAIGERSFNVALTNVNEPPWLAPVADTNLLAGRTLTITNTATDPEAPPQFLTFSLLDPLEGASVNATNGLFTWRPAIAQGDTTNLLLVKVADNGTPNLIATQAFTVTVLRPVEPSLAAQAFTNGQFSLLISGDTGPDYDIYSSTNLTDWSLLQQLPSPTLPFLFADPDGTNFTQRFYRARIGP